VHEGVNEPEFIAPKIGGWGPAMNSGSKLADLHLPVLARASHSIGRITPHHRRNLRNLPLIVVGVGLMVLAAFQSPMPAASAPSPTAIPISCKVVDEAGKPIAGAHVLVNTQTMEGDPEALAKGITGADGMFATSIEIPTLASQKRYIFNAWMPGRALASHYTDPAKPSTPVLTLSPVEPFKFRLVDMAGKPVSGAEVTLERRSKRGVAGQYGFVPGPPEWFKEIGIPEPPVVTTSSDANGDVTLPFVAHGDSVSLTVLKPGFRRSLISMNGAEDANLAVRLIPGTQIKGRIKTAAGVPLPAHQAIRLRGPGSYTGQLVDVDATGSFQIDGLGEEPVYLTLPAGSPLVIPMTILHPQPGAAMDAGSLLATPGCVVTGKVTGLDMTAAFAPGVVAVARNANGSIPWYELDKVEPDGHYTLRLPPGEFSVYYADLDTYSPNSAPVKKTITAHEGETLHLDLEPPRAATMAAQPPARTVAPLASSLSGTVINGDTGGPIPNAHVSVYNTRQENLSAVSGADGLFSIKGLQSASAGGEPYYLLTTTAPGFSKSIVAVDSHSQYPVKIALSSTSDLKIRVVATDGKPIAGAGVTTGRCFSFVHMREYARSIEIPRDLVPGAADQHAVSDADGMVTFSGMPSNVFMEVQVQHPDNPSGNLPDYADCTHVVALPHPGVAPLPLSKETTIEGDVKLADGRPVPYGLYLAKSQAWRYPEMYRWATIRADGHYTLQNEPSLDLLNEDALSLNLEVPRDPKTQPDGITSQYVNGWNFMLTIDKDGKKERWISYVEGEGLGEKYAESDQITHDITLYPMALIQGKVVLPAGKPAPAPLTVSYEDPRSIYGPWQVTCDAAGNFELPVPTGDVTLNLGNNPQRFPWGQPNTGGALTATMVVKDLKAQEVRSVEIKPGQQDTPAARLEPTTMIAFRVLGPDGATVPWPEVEWSAGAGGRAAVQVGGIDGLVTLWTGTVGQAITVTSPYLKAPVVFPANGVFKPTPVQFDRLPTTPHPPAERGMPAFLVDTARADALPSPEVVPVGAAAPELRVDQWAKGKSVRLADFKGKVVVIGMGGEWQAPLLNRLASRFRNKPVALILLLDSRMANGSSSLESSSFSNLTAVGSDPPTVGGGGFNQRRLGGRLVIIGPDGRLADMDLDPPFLQARIDQLLAAAEKPH
nr:carboxypeptidase regulatory-like domain-containing protein [Armatimonadota bacterium]